MAFPGGRAEVLSCWRGSYSHLIYPDSPGPGVRCPGDSGPARAFTAAASCCYETLLPPAELGSW